MTYSIDQLKGAVSRGKGFARPNLYAVHLPRIGSSNAEDLNLVCKATELPGRQIISVDQQIGTPLRKVANGYAVTDLNMTFYVLNDHAVKKYFEDWQNLAHDNQTYEVGYYKDYVKDVQIQQLQKGNIISLYRKQLGIVDRVPPTILNRLPTFERSIGLISGSLDLSQGLVDVNIDLSETPVYTVDLRECYPTSVNAIPLGDEQTGVIELSVQMSYKNWTSSLEEPRDNFIPNIINGVLQFFR